MAIGNEATHQLAGCTIYGLAVHNGQGTTPVYLGADTLGRLTYNGTAMPQTSGTVALTDAATIATDVSLGSVFTVTLGGNRTLGNPTNPVDGQQVTWRIKQDGVGSKTLALDTQFRLGTTVPSSTLTTTASKTDYLICRYNDADLKWDVLFLQKGF